MFAAKISPVRVTRLVVAVSLAVSNAAGAAASFSLPAPPLTVLRTPSTAPPGPSAGETIKLTIGYPPGASTIAPLFVAQGAGFFARHGLSVSLESIKPTVQIAALDKGELQIASLGGQEVVNAGLGGISVVMVAAASDYPIFSLYTAKSITRVQDLAGKTIGVTAKGTSTDATAKLFLEHFGLLGQVRIVPSGGTNTGVLAALQNGLVAGGILGVPWTIQAAQAGLIELVNGIKLGIPLTLSAIVVTRSYLKERRGVVERFLRAYQEAWTFMAMPANESAVEKVLASYLKVSPEVAKGTYDYLLPIWSGKKIPTVDPRGVANALRFSENPKAKAAAPDAFIDNSIIESLK